MFGLFGRRDPKAPSPPSARRLSSFAILGRRYLYDPPIDGYRVYQKISGRWLVVGFIPL
jgi:hypothetical protein